MAPSSPRPIHSPATFLSDLTKGQKQGHPSMKFLLEFASCCGPAPPRSSFPVTSSSSSRYGERRRPSGYRRPTRRPPPSRRPRRALKRRRLAPPSDWRPTLVPIYEYDDNGEDEEEEVVAAATRRSDASRELLYDYDSRRGGGYKMITEFYPMPYMF